MFGVWLFTLLMGEFEHEITGGALLSSWGDFSPVKPRSKTDGRATWKESSLFGSRDLSQHRGDRGEDAN